MLRLRRLLRPPDRPQDDAQQGDRAGALQLRLQQEGRREEQARRSRLGRQFQRRGARFRLTEYPRLTRSLLKYKEAIKRRL